MMNLVNFTKEFASLYICPAQFGGLPTGPFLIAVDIWGVTVLEFTFLEGKCEREKRR